MGSVGIPDIGSSLVGGQPTGSTAARSGTGSSVSHSGGKSGSLRCCCREYIAHCAEIVKP